MCHRQGRQGLEGRLEPAPYPRSWTQFGYFSLGLCILLDDLPGRLDSEFCPYPQNYSWWYSQNLCTSRISRVLSEGTPHFHNQERGNGWKPPPGIQGSKMPFKESPARRLSSSAGSEIQPVLGRGSFSGCQERPCVKEGAVTACGFTRAWKVRSASPADPHSPHLQCLWRGGPLGLGQGNTKGGQ